MEAVGVLGSTLSPHRRSCAPDAHHLGSGSARCLNTSIWAQGLQHGAAVLVPVRPAGLADHHEHCSLERIQLKIIELQPICRRLQALPELPSAGGVSFHNPTKMLCCLECAARSQALLPLLTAHILPPWMYLKAHVASRLA